MDEPVVDSEQAESEPQRGRGPWHLIILVVILTLLGVWLVPDEEAPEPIPIPRPNATTAPQAPAAPVDLPLEEPLRAGETAMPAEDADLTDATGLTQTEEPLDNSPGAKARRMIAEMRSGGELSIEDIYAAAEDAQARGELSDAYLLYFFAAREGHAPAALTLAHQSDPAGFRPDASLFERPDLSQAHKWYLIAAEGGSAEARTALIALRKRIEKMADGGDPEAQRITLQWQ